MTDANPESVASRWARLGVILNVPPAAQTPDVERLLLDTARAAPANTRLLTLAATWLSVHGALVHIPRLANLIHDELEPEHRPTLGLLLETAAQHARTRGPDFEHAIEACKPPQDAMPLSQVERLNPQLHRLSAERATALSRKWGRWTTDTDLQPSALRPPEWVRRHNPSPAQTAGKSN